MLVQNNHTKRELDMFWIKVDARTAPAVEKILKRYTKACDESYLWIESDDRYALTCRVVCTARHHSRLMRKLITQGCAIAYENFI